MNENLKEKIKILKEKIQNNPDDKRSMHLLAWLYDNDLKDIDNAIVYYKIAASKNHQISIYNLADIYNKKGQSDKAIELLLKIQKDVDSIWQLGTIYKKRRDYTTALEWFKKGDVQNDGECQNQIAYIFYHGLGVEKNLDTAFEYYQKSANNGDVLSQRQIPALYTLGHGCQRDLIKAHQARKDVQIKDWVIRFNLAKDYELGTGTDIDLKIAHEMYESLANDGDKDGMFMIGYFYEMGKYLPCDINKSLEWYKKGSEKDDIDCNFKLSELSITRNDRQVYFEKYILKKYKYTLFHDNTKTRTKIKVDPEYVYNWLTAINEKNKEIETLKLEILEYELRPPSTSGGQLFLDAKKRFDANITRTSTDL